MSTNSHSFVPIGSRHSRFSGHFYHTLHLPLLLHLLHYIQLPPIWHSRLLCPVNCISSFFLPIWLSTRRFTQPYNLSLAPSGYQTILGAFIPRTLEELCSKRIKVSDVDNYLVYSSHTHNSRSSSCVDKWNGKLCRRDVLVLIKITAFWCVDLMLR